MKGMDRGMNLDCTMDEYMHEQAKDVDIYDIEKLSYQYGFLKTSEIASQNDFYGIARTLKKFAGISEDIPLYGTIEHGMYFENGYCWCDDIRYPTKNIVCMSEFRSNVISRLTFKEPTVIGPYIAYAENFYSDAKMHEIKNNIGKTLLVMPVHSLNGIDEKYDIEDFIKEINHIKDEYEYSSVMVCLYWKELVEEFILPYRENGYKIVSAGHIYDKYFLNRLRAIIELSDGVLMNRIGTNLGYSMYFGKPCRLYPQKIEYERKDALMKTAYYLASDEYVLLNKLFSNAKMEITEEQISACNYIFGLNEVKNQQQMKAIMTKLTTKVR
jgi:hypothetical protein